MFLNLDYRELSHILRIIGVLIENDKISRTKLKDLTKMNYNLLKKYLNLMEKENMITIYRFNTFEFIKLNLNNNKIEKCKKFIEII